jgi:hypothetical protein
MVQKMCKKIQMFLASFYCYLNYDQKNDFVVDLQNVWKWCGFSRIDPAKRILTTNFTKDVDFIVEKAAPPNCGAGRNLGGSGLNKERILMTVRTFKKFCLKAKTKKADEVQEYYLQMEEVLQETISEETDELRNQLLVKDRVIKEKEKELEEHEKEIEKLKKVKNKLYIGHTFLALITFGQTIQFNKFITLSSKSIYSKYSIFKTRMNRLVIL